MTELEETLRNYAAHAETYYLRPGFLYVTETPCAISTILGSCVSVCLFDKNKGYGGMNHFLLPAQGKQDTGTRYAEAAMEALISTMFDFGSKQSDLSARIVGGAWRSGSSQSELIATQNALVARKILEAADIKITSEETGGTRARKVLFLNELDKLLVVKLAESSV